MSVKNPEEDFMKDDVDQNILVEYGLVKSFEYHKHEHTNIEKAVFFKDELPPEIKILMILDKQTPATLKLIYTYLELQLGIEPRLPNIKDFNG